MSAVDPATGRPGPPGSSDAELLAAVRGRPADAASTAAFGALWDRHHDAARALARQLTRNPADSEDLVSAAFARMLEVLRSGGGPTEAFRAYLLTSVRHLAYDRSRAERRLDLTEDIGDVVGVDPERTVVPFADTAVAGLERSLAARAFATLPERWQAVLWHLEVEGDAPATVAPLFGLSPNAVSALGYRAREGLRQAYLQEHLASESSGSPPRDRRHRETEERLGAYTRGGLSQRDASRVEAHLAECEECRALAAELREVNSGIVRAAVGPTVLGAALVGYLATRGVGTADASSALPTTGELVVAGGGALGVLGALGGALRPGTLVPTALARAASPAGALTVGLVGLGVAAAGMVGAGGLLGPGGPFAAAPGADAPDGARPWAAPQRPVVPVVPVVPGVPTTPGVPVVPPTVPAARIGTGDGTGDGTGRSAGADAGGSGTGARSGSPTSGPTAGAGRGGRHPGSATARPDAARSGRSGSSGPSTTPGPTGRPGRHRVPEAGLPGIGQSGVGQSGVGQSGAGSFGSGRFGAHQSGAAREPALDGVLP